MLIEIEMITTYSFHDAVDGVIDAKFVLRTQHAFLLRTMGILAEMF